MAEFITGKRDEAIGEGVHVLVDILACGDTRTFKSSYVIS